WRLGSDGDVSVSGAEGQGPQALPRRRRLPPRDPSRPSSRRLRRRELLHHARPGRAGHRAGNGEEVSIEAETYRPIFGEWRPDPTHSDMHHPVEPVLLAALDLPRLE